MRFALVAAGTVVPAVARWQTCDEYIGGDIIPELRTAFTTAYAMPIEILPYVRQTTYWRRVDYEPLGTVGIFSRAVTVSYGIEETEAYEMSASITATAGAEVGAWSAELSTTLTATYGRSVTIFSEDTVTETYTAPPNKPNYNQMYSLWEEVEVIEIVKADRSLWESAHYRLQDPERQLRLVHPTGRVTQLSQWYRLPGS
jgi:hypothetical protein